MGVRIKSDNNCTIVNETLFGKLILSEKCLSDFRIKIQSKIQRFGC